MSDTNFMSYSDAETVVTGIADKYKTFKGTQTQWDALSLAEKVKYSFADITDDYAGTGVVDAVTNGDMNPISSNAVYDYLNDQVNVTKQSSDTSWSDIVKRLYALIDFSRINANSVLVMDGYVYRVAYYDPTLASVSFERAHTRYTSTPGLTVDYISIGSSGGYHYSASLKFSTNTWTNQGLDSTVPNSMIIFYR